MSMIHLIFIWLVAAGLVWASYREAVQSWGRTVQSTSLAAAAYVQQSVNAAALVLKSIQDRIAGEHIASEVEFRRLMSERRVFEMLGDRISGMPQIRTAGIIARNGDLVTSTASFPAPLFDLSGREAFKAQMEGNRADVSLTAAARSTTLNRWAFYLSQQIRSNSGEIFGVITIGLNAPYFSALFRQIAGDQGSEITLFRRDGTLLATTLADPDLQGKRYPDATLARMIRNGSSGAVEQVAGANWSDPHDQDNRLAASRLVGDFPLLVSVSIGSDIYLGAWRKGVTVILGVAILLSGLTILIGAHLVKLILKAEKTERVAGDRRVLAALVNTPAALCAVVDRQDRLLYCNERFRNTLGSRENAAALFSDPRLHGGGDVLRFARGHETEAIELDLQLEREGHAMRHLRFSVSRQALPHVGECTILIGHDETARHQAQRVLAQSAKMVMLGEMTTGMAHELSQPLNVVRMAAQNALTEIDPAEGGLAAPGEVEPMTASEFRSFAAGKFNRIIAQVDRAADILSRMRIFGRTSDAPEKIFDVREACRSALALIGPRIRSAGIALHEDLGTASLPMLGRQDLLEQVLVNLLMNARDALKDSSQADKQITLLARPAAGGRLAIDLADNGPGVPPEIRDRIFEPFFTAKPIGQGTGLGLALSFGIIRDAGGTLSLMPTPSGATFRIELPVATGEMPARSSTIAQAASPPSGDRGQP